LIILAVPAKIEKKSNLPKTGRDMDMREDRISCLSRSRVMGDTSPPHHPNPQET